jgi:hypothetical protein
VGKKFGRRWWRLVRSLLRSKARGRAQRGRDPARVRLLARTRVERARSGDDNARV